MPHRLPRSERLRLIRSLFPGAADRPDEALAFELLDLSAVLAGGSLSDPRRRYLEPLIREEALRLVRSQEVTP